MNYILLHSSYGKESMRMTVERMEQQCSLLIKNSRNDWVHYSPVSKQYTELHGILEFMLGALNGNNRVINWGNNIFAHDEYFCLNVPSAVALTSNKRRSRKLLQARGVAVPFTQFYGQRLRFPCIARPSYHHGGKNFHVLNNESEFNTWERKQGDLEDWYFSAIFEKTHEFRVHCAHGKILLISDKPLVEGEIRANMAVNHESWRAIKWSEYNPVVCVESLRAIEVLGLDYGAVDIMYNAQNNSVAICEVNTSPSINTEYSSGKYAEYFDWCIRHDFPAHFPIDGKSVFYNNILRE